MGSRGQKELLTSNDKDYEIALIYPSSHTIQEAIDVVKKEYENLKNFLSFRRANV